MSIYTCSCCHTEFDIPENIPLDAVFYDFSFEEGEEPFLLCYNCAVNMPVILDADDFEPYVSDQEYDLYPDVEYGDYTYLMYVN